MINAHIDNSQKNIECSGNLPTLMTETGILLGNILYNLSKQTGLSVEFIGQGIGLILPDIIKDYARKEEKNE